MHATAPPPWCGKPVNWTGPLRDTRNAIAALQRRDAPMRVVWDAKDRLLPVTYKLCFVRDLDAGLQYVFQGRHFTPKDHSEVVGGY
jgi:hypothetical protein